MSNNTLQIELNTASTITAGMNVLFDTETYSSGSITYDSATGVITFSQAGSYVIEWWLAMYSSQLINETAFALVSSQGDYIKSSIIDNSDKVIGVGIINIITPPVTLSLVNVSTRTIYFSFLSSLKGTLVIAEDNTKLTNLVDGNNTGAVRGIGTKNDYTMGLYAFAEGNNTIASGGSSHAEGISTVASQWSAHAEGISTEASGGNSHTEGNSTAASGGSSHAEGYSTVASGDSSHAEGDGTTASGGSSHAEGDSTTASQWSSHAEGYSTVASGGRSHAEGDSTVASGGSSHAEGISTVASQWSAHAEGISTEASGGNSHAEGNSTTASGGSSHAEGYSTTASGDNSHAEGDSTIASGRSSHAEGINTLSSQLSSHAEGIGAEARGYNSHAEGYYTIANGYYSHAEGYYTSANLRSGAHIMGKNGDAGDDNSWFLANGTHYLYNRGLAAKILYDGNAYIDVSWNTGGADYAELFETADGKTIEPGYFVTFDGSGQKIRKSAKSDSYILGVVTKSSGFVGDSGELRWKGKYLTDEWGEIQYHEVTISEKKDDKGNVLLPEHTEIQPILNPEWDNTKEYVPRLKRPEWVTVGILGKLRIRDDGTCIPGGYCRPSDNGIATTSESGYRVLERLSENRILIYSKGN